MKRITFALILLTALSINTIKAADNTSASTTPGKDPKPAVASAAAAAAVSQPVSAPSKPAVGSKPAPTTVPAVPAIPYKPVVGSSQWLNQIDEDVRDMEAQNYADILRAIPEDCQTLRTTPRRTAEEERLYKIKVASLDRLDAQARAFFRSNPRHAQKHGIQLGQ